MNLIKFNDGYIDQSLIFSITACGSGYEAHLICSDSNNSIDVSIPEDALSTFTTGLVEMADTDGDQMWIRESSIVAIQNCECYFVITLSNGEIYNVESIDSLSFVETIEPSFLIWWLDEKDCKLIGEPKLLADIKQMPQYPFQQYSGICCIENLPFPQYLKELYCSRYGRPGNGRVWYPLGVSCPSVELNGNDQKIENSGGLVFYSEDFSILKKFPGLITDFTGCPVDCESDT